MIKSFTHFKRFVCPGMTFRCEHFFRPEISGLRKIIKVQSNAIQYEWTKPDGSPSVGWCYWPKSVNEVSVKGSSVIFLDGPNGKPLFAYHVTDEPIPELKEVS